MEKDNPFPNQPESFKLNSYLLELRQSLMDRMSKPYDWQSFWSVSPTKSGNIQNRGRGLVTESVKNERERIAEALGIFFRLRLELDNPALNDSDVDDLQMVKNHFRHLFQNELPENSVVNQLIFLRQQQSIRTELDGDVISSWLVKTPAPELRRELKAYSEAVTQLHSLENGELTKELNKALYEDLLQANEDYELTNHSLLGLREKIARFLLLKMGLKSDKGYSKGELAKLMKQNPELFYMVLALEKEYLIGHVERVRRENEALRHKSPLSLQEEDEFQFNVSVPYLSKSIMLEAQENPFSLEKNLRKLQTEELLEVLSAYYLDTWSRTWHEDSEYVSSFPANQRSLVGRYVPLASNGKIMSAPDVHMQVRDKYLYEKYGRTESATFSHLPSLRLPFSVKALKTFSFFLGEKEVGTFFGVRVSQDSSL